MGEGEEDAVPERPVRQEAHVGVERLLGRPPPLVLGIRVHRDAGAREEAADACVLLLVEVGGDGLVVGVGEEAVEPPGERVVGVAGFLGLRVMHVVADDVDLVGAHADDEVPGDESPELALEAECPMRPESVEPHRSVRPHQHHAVDEPHDYQRPAEVEEEEGEEEGSQRRGEEPHAEALPILAAPQDVHATEHLVEESARGRDRELAIRRLPTVGGLAKSSVEKGDATLKVGWRSTACRSSRPREAGR